MRVSRGTEEGARAMRGALSWPFLRLYILTLLYFSANSILNVIIPLKGAELGATNTTIGVVMGAYLFTTMFFGRGQAISSKNIDQSKCSARFLFSMERLSFYIRLLN